MSTHNRICPYQSLKRSLATLTWLPRHRNKVLVREWMVPDLQRVLARHGQIHKRAKQMHNQLEMEVDKELKKLEK